MISHVRAAALVISASTVCAVTSPSANAETWMNEDWNCRIEFSAKPDSIEGVGSFNDFTLLLKLDATSFASVFAAADFSGSDLVITTADGATVLDHEIVSYDPMLQVAELWFKATTFSDAENTFYLYFSNNVETPEEAAIRASLPGDAWTAEHLAVYHFAEDPSLGTLADWGLGGNDAVATTGSNPVGPGWTISNLVDGAVGTGWAYDGVDLLTYTGNVSSTAGSYTISAWFANSDMIDGGAVAFDVLNDLLTLSFQRTQGQVRSNLDTIDGFISWLPEVLDNELHHFAWTMDAEADTARFFFDGIERDISARYTHDQNQGAIYSGESIHSPIGIAGPAVYNAPDLSDGVVDEYRIIEGVRTPDWLLTEYRNQRDNAGFFSVQDEEHYTRVPTGIGSSSFTNPFGRMTVSPNPFRAVASIELETEATDVTVRVYDVKGRLVRTLRLPTSAGGGTMRFLWDGRDAAGTQVSNGIYYIRAQNGQEAVSTKALLVR